MQMHNQQNDETRLTSACILPNSLLCLQFNKFSYRYREGFRKNKDRKTPLAKSHYNAMVPALFLTRCRTVQQASPKACTIRIETVRFLFLLLVANPNNNISFFSSRVNKPVSCYNLFHRVNLMNHCFILTTLK